MEFNGIVTYVPVSGGFWGLLAENGRRFRPVNEIPEEFQEEGLPIHAKVDAIDVFSIFMWGTDVEVKEISRLDQLESQI